VSDEQRDQAAAEQRAIEAALRVVERAGPLAGHPTYQSAWRRLAQLEQVDNRMAGR